MTQATRHWGRKKVIFDLWEELVFWYSKTAENRPEVLPFDLPVFIRVTGRFKDKRRRDLDGFCLKPIIDGLVRAGVLKDDSMDYVESIMIVGKNGQEADETVIELLNRFKTD